MGSPAVQKKGLQSACLRLKKIGQLRLLGGTCGRRVLGLAGFRSLTRNIAQLVWKVTHDLGTLHAGHYMKSDTNCMRRYMILDMPPGGRFSTCPTPRHLYGTYVIWLVNYNKLHLDMQLRGLVSGTRTLSGRGESVCDLRSITLNV